MDQSFSECNNDHLPGETTGDNFRRPQDHPPLIAHSKTYGQNPLTRGLNIV